MRISRRRATACFSAALFSVGLACRAEIAPAATSPAPMTFTTPPMTLVDFPSAPLPAAPAAPVAVAAEAARTFDVKGGETVGTPCFTTVVPLDAVVTVEECSVNFAYRTNGPGSDPDDYYAKISVVATGRQSLGEIETAVFAALEKRNAGSSSSDRYGDDDGNFVGTSDVSIFGAPALVFAWGLDTKGPNVTTHTTHVEPDGTRRDVISHKSDNETLELFQLLARDRYALGGDALDTLVIKGNSIGFETQSFAFVVNHLRLR